MIGTIVNTCTILIGSLVGSVLKRGIKEKYQKALFGACGLAACGVGINAVVSHMPDSKAPVLFIVSLALGSLLGTRLNLEDRFQKMINRHSKSNLGQGLSAAILIFCIGSLSIMGPVMSALYGDHTFLFTNATLDLITSMVLASTYGIGIALAAPVLFCWQGGIYLIAKYASASLISDDLVCELCIVGGFLIASTGLNILNIKNLKSLNMLPSLAVPIVYFAIKGILNL